MKRLKVCFIGIGSIAKRHINNLTYICKNDKIELRIDAVRRNAVESKNGKTECFTRIYSKCNEIDNNYDAIFITNPTEMHYETLKEVENKSNCFFIEKPICSYNQLDLIQGHDFNKKIYYVACPLRYNAVIQYIKNNIDYNSIISARSISSSYLPNWRKGVDYKNTYSAHRELGGGVAIDLIHEWDYITYLFGFPNEVKSFIGKKSDLEIDSDDYAIYIAEYNSMIVELHLDYFGRQTIREIELITKNGTIIGDIANNKIIFLQNGKVIDFCEERDDYQIRELRYFLRIIDEKNDKECNEDSNATHAIQVLKVSKGEYK